MNSSVRRSPRFARSVSPERKEAANTLLSLRNSREAPRMRSMSPPRVVMRSASPPRRRSARVAQQAIVGHRRSPRIAALHAERQNDLKEQLTEFRDGLKERTDALEHASNKFNALHSIVSYLTENVGTWYFGKVSLKSVVESLLTAMREVATTRYQQTRYRAARHRLQDAIADMEFVREHGL